MKKALEWLDHRTGICTVARDALYENIPGGAKWRYVWGTVLLFALGAQFLTGLFLWMNYSPGVHTAWESVNYIQNEIHGGWLLRGLHHYLAQVIPALLFAHLVQVVIAGSYRAPREFNFWVGLCLLVLVLLIALTGYQLPWDQKGYWASKVAMSLLGIVPFAGHALQRIVMGGADYGQLSLTRFFALHAGILPCGVLLLLGVHGYLFRRHGFTKRAPETRTGVPFWPDQALRNAVACLALMVALLLLIFQHRILSTPGPLGAELSAPADPSEPYAAARPEWSFLPMFQFLKSFPSGTEVYGAIFIPGVVFTIMLLMPLTARLKFGHRFNVAFLAALMCGAAALACVAIHQDRHNAEYQLAVKESQRNAERIQALTHALGVPEGGAITLEQNDAYTQGPKLFAKNCASCHRYDGGDGTGRPVKDPQSASDLAGFGSREWLTGLLDPARISTTNYFGGTKFRDSKMAKFVKKTMPGYTAEQKENLKMVIAALSGEAHLKSQGAEDMRDAAAITNGAALLQGDMKCTDCHQFRVRDENASAPDLTGYASREWLMKIISNPAHPDLYGDINDRMPAYGDKGIMTQREIGLLSDWLRGDWYEPTQAADAK
jgi:ubiquinol-cytochrome c reductase cytochrome b subunit